MLSIVFLQMRLKRSDRWGLLGAAKGDIKLLLVPVIFFLLRIWNQIINGILHYNSKDSDTRENFKHSVAAAVLVVFAVSKGYNQANIIVR